MKISDIREMVLGMYLRNDAAHQIDHADEVYNNMLVIIEKLNINIDEREVVIAAYFHDCFSSTRNRDRHEQLAGDYIRTHFNRLFSSLFLEKNKEELNEVKLRVSNAIREHRASYKGERISNLSNVLAVADRGFISKNRVKEIAIRSFQYNRARSENVEKIYENVFEHIVDKFSRSGYAFDNVPKYFMDINSENIEYMWDEIDNLTLKKVKKMIGEE
jgi:HD superfamily phosphodiesterase